MLNAECLMPSTQHSTFNIQHSTFNIMKFSIRLNNDLPVKDYVELAQIAEQAGFDQIWVSDDLFLRGVWPILSACAVATRRIGLGTCIVNPYTCHPAEIAMQAVALDELSGGRLHLGVAAGAGEFLGWLGMPQPRPLAVTAETIRRLRALFAGEAGPFSGTGWPDWGAEAYMRVPSRPIPIYLGAMSPRMHALVGELADGGLPLLFPPERYAEVAARVAGGAARAGRDMADIDLAACIWVSVAERREEAEAALRAKVAYYANAMSDEVLSGLGVSREETAQIAAVAQAGGDLGRAAGMVSPALLRIGVASIRLCRVATQPNASALRPNVPNTHGGPR
ncbi:LLM class flavin-dependent oxidoreductase [Oscillochloris sp. ZM17-4]|uniref:LLM class flavin-dependent oxidoreductase n=1 Tax=Oscillochloris sp. ZM17-4 TaxID=2866714 RepID=UPI001C72E4C9|nr:LLM class flavin-dependent oxidoreductase [Oscillochloris sp. ZM17-4]MBX0326655.1 LLM class flavin-dependent oxidoreductase [Oscillochloris sp. ZM17-4]